MVVTFVSSECTPFIKTGGLADVVGTLPQALSKLGIKTSVIIPKYSRIPESFRYTAEHVAEFYVSMGWRSQYVGVDKLSLNGIDFYLADNEYYFKQNYIYSDGNFETERFCWFCRAAMEIMSRCDMIPDILHLNDWQTGLIPMLLEEQYRFDARWSNVKTLLTIHNLRYQGLMNPQLVNDMLGVGQCALEKAEYYCNVNALKAGIVYANMISTVSPTYAEEIKSPVYGETLDGLLRTKDIRGILNGIDVNSYNPWTDKALAARYSKRNTSGKQRCKLAIMEELGLEVDANAPLIAVISRLTNQKGLDLFEAVIPGLIDLGAELIVLGMGDGHYEQRFAAEQAYNPRRFQFRSEMNDELARRIYAGADIFLMPSAFEPCGLSQLFALRYGCIPVVRETGGLADSINPFNRFTGEGNGFSFKNYSANELYNAARDAIFLYRDFKVEWQKLVVTAMSCDFSWRRSADRYKAVYGELCGKI